MDKPFEASAIGSKADIQAGVDISKVVGGYFENPANTKAFCDIGIKPIEGNLPHKIFLVDFGGGQGFLASRVEEYLAADGFEVSSLVADGNASYLDEAKKKGLAVVACNLEECAFENVNLATMRAVLHYNNPEKQLAIIKSIYGCLIDGGYFVHQASSGSEVNSRLRSEIVNIPALGRAGNGQYHWTSTSETLGLHQESGFAESVVFGFAPGAAWGPEEQWDRFNAKRTHEAREAGDTTVVAQIENTRAEYLAAAQTLIEDYLEKYGAEETGIEKLSDGRFMIHYEYPIIVSKK